MARDWNDDEVWRLARRVGGEKLKVSPAARSRLRRIAKRTPEVVVKLTGRTRRGPVHLKHHLDYISRNMKLVMTTQSGEQITDRDRLRTLHDDWVGLNATQQVARPSPNAAQSVSIVLSMSPQTPADKVEQAARVWARETLGGKYDYVMVRHDPEVDKRQTTRPHMHVTVRAVGYDGKRLSPGPEDLQLWRERFARELRRIGVEAEATPRQARGIVQKSKKNAIYHVQEKAKKQGKADPYVLQRQRRAAEKAAQAPEQEPTSWEKKIQARQDSINRAYLNYADQLDRGDADDRRLARDLRKVVAEMPLPLPRRKELEVHMRCVRNQEHGLSHPTSSRPQEPHRERDAPVYGQDTPDAGPKLGR
jgi:type IV secretory pathway VirD2 relaxase